MNRLGVRCFHRWVAPTLKALKTKKDRLPHRPPDPRNSYVEWNYEAELYSFGKRLGENFQNNLLRQALTEKSFVDKERKERMGVNLEPDETLVDNTDMSDRGEHIINDYIDRYLTATLPLLPGHYKYRIKEFLTSEETLAHISKLTGTDDIVLNDKYPCEEKVLCNVLKAVVCALDESNTDPSVTDKFIRDLIVSQLSGTDLTPLCTPEDPYRTLEETLQLEKRPPPEPRLLAQAAVNTLLPVYHVGVYSDKRLLGSGFGEGLEIAKEMAACDALWRMWGVGARMRPFPFDLEFPPRERASQTTPQ